MLPFEGVKSIRWTLITRAKGWVGWAKSESEWTGWRCWLVGVGRAEFPEQKVHLGLGPRWVLVRWVARGLRKIDGGKYWFVGGGSCWTGEGVSIVFARCGWSRQECVLLPTL